MRNLVVSSALGLVILVVPVTSLRAQTTSRIVFQSKIDRAWEDIWMANEDGTNPTNVTAIAHDPTDIYVDIEPKLCRNKIVFVSDKGGSYDIWVINLDGSGATNLTSGTLDSDETEPDCIIPDPVELGTAGRVVFQSDSDSAEGEIYTIPITGGLWSRLTNNSVPDTDPSWCGTSNIIFAREVPIENCLTTQPFHIFIMEKDGANATQLTGGEHHHSEPSCSPDGMNVAYRIAANCGTPPSLGMIYRQPTTCNTAACTSACGTCTECPCTILTECPLGCGDNTEPSWSPMGGHMAFSSNRVDPGGGDYEIYRMNAEEGHNDQANFFQLTVNTVPDAAPDWSEVKP